MFQWLAGRCGAVSGAGGHSRVSAKGVLQVRSPLGRVSGSVAMHAVQARPQFKTHNAAQHTHAYWLEHVPGSRILAATLLTRVCQHGAGSMTEVGQRPGGVIASVQASNRD